MALANIALDLLGQARSLYSYAAEVEGKGNDEDQIDRTLEALPGVLERLRSVLPVR